MKWKVCSKAILFTVLFFLFLTVGVWAVDVTVYSVSDVHFTANTFGSKTRAGVQAMNNMPGMSWVYGTVANPNGVIIPGDLCDGGAWGTTPATDTPQWYSNRNFQDQWTGFNNYFPKSGYQGDNNRLKYSTYATGGNHDYWRWCGYTLGTSSYVKNQLYARYGEAGGASSEGNVYYSWDFQGIKFISLGRYPDTTVLSWLSSQLASFGTSTPVVLFMHYALDDDEEWWTYDQRQLLLNVIAGYNIIAVLNGHTHASHHYTWNGFDVYDDGSLGEYGEIGVMHITDSTIDYAIYVASDDGYGNWTGGSWSWNYRKYR